MKWLWNKFKYASVKAPKYQPQGLEEDSVPLPDVPAVPTAPNRNKSAAANSAPPVQPAPPQQAPPLQSAAGYPQQQPIYPEYTMPPPPPMGVHEGGQPNQANYPAPPYHQPQYAPAPPNYGVAAQLPPAHFQAPPPAVPAMPESQQAATYQAAAAGHVPAPPMGEEAPQAPQRLLYDSHMHTPLCKHAEGKPDAYAKVGWEKGLRGIIFTCHIPMPPNFSPNVRMRLNELPRYCDMVYEAAASWAEKQLEFEILLGIESEYFPGYEAWVADIHSRVPFHYVLGSVHPFLKEYKDRYHQSTDIDLQMNYFTHLAEAAETGLYDALSHPDVVKTMFPDSWDTNPLLDHTNRCLDRIAATHVAMELNTSGLIKSYQEMNPGRWMLQMMAERQIPVVLGSDAHRPERVAADFENALMLLWDVGYRDIHVCVERTLYAHPIREVMATLRQTSFAM